MPGLFVTFEGGEGTGKSTQIRRLADRLRARGESPVVTREPGGTPLAERVRDILFAVDRDESPRARPRDDVAAVDATPDAWSEVFLLEAARTDLVRKVILPALASGRVVLCDRFDDSTIAYQGGGRGLDVTILESLNRAATGGLRPDLTFLFDLEPGEGLQRRSEAGDANRLDREPQEFHQRVRAAYRSLASREPERFVLVDARQNADTLERQVWSAFEARNTRRTLNERA